MSDFTIIGQGLAGTCLAWEFWKREVPFQLIDREQGGSSRVAAGLINPVTGKNYEPSPHLTTFLPQAMELYGNVEETLGRSFWHPHTIIRLAGNEREWNKMQEKAALPEVARWVENGPTPFVGSDWLGRLVLHSGGRLDTLGFLDGSREFFRQHGCYRQAEVAIHDAPANTVWCEGAVGLIAGRYGDHRCAKGEILTGEAPDWNESFIQVGGGGWTIPIGNHRFKVGSTYEWDQLDEEPTAEAREQLEMLAQKLGGSNFQVIDHEAGIRPILRRSLPLIGPIGKEQWMFNALGSKGSLYAPGIAGQLADWLIKGEEPYTQFNYLDFRG